MTTGVPPRVSSFPDEELVLGLLAEQALGWPGQPGLTGHRHGRGWSPLFTGPDVDAQLETKVQRLRTNAADSAAELSLRVEIELDQHGVGRLRGSVRDDCAAPYALDELVLGLPVPSEADELLDLTGRHLRERSPQRQPFTVGMRIRDGRRGRTGLDATLLMVAGAAGFGSDSGEVWVCVLSRRAAATR